ncbi:MAG: hypothetical protein WBM99_13355 [Psychromonas sp.]
MIQAIYDEMWVSFCSALKHNQYLLDPFIGCADDTRRGITALAYLESNNKLVSREIALFLRQIQLIEPQQYYHPIDELHLTVLSIITCIAGFELADINPIKYADVFYKSFKGIDPIEIRFQGVTASPSCIVIQGFPVGNGLDQLRQNLRKQFEISGLCSSIDSRYRLKTAHITAIRFCSPIKDASKLESVCKKYKNHLFGKVKFTEFDLVFNNWYQNLSVTKVLGHCSIP